MGTFSTLRDRRRALGLVAVVVASASFFTSSPGVATPFLPYELPVSVEERPGMVRLHVLLPADVSPASIEVIVTGHDVVVLGRREGLTVRSRPIRLLQAVAPQGAEADYEADGSLTITLRAHAHGGP